ncbi:hypothetical protein [Paraburkholderia sp. BCC1885]|uniref:hypothetical protein n=1 Tax=Paraburkholderia sp. BCC1885 TaxID=2562669 RepID=UPI001182ABCC|nr:hypothetical protein [Paraburkholderia sp. BCC1885]
MSEIKINTGRTNTTTHRAVLDSAALERVIIEHVAAAAGVNPDASCVRVQCNLSSRMGNYGIINEGIVTITVDHSAAPQVGDSL